MSEHPSAEGAQDEAPELALARRMDEVGHANADGLMTAGAMVIRRLQADNEVLRARVQELGAVAKRERARVQELEDAWNQALAAAPGPAMTREEISKAARQHPAEDICYWSHRMGVQDAERHHGVGAKGESDGNLPD